MKIKRKTLIIAEAGVNHNGSLNTAFRLCKIAKKSGADYVKFQIFDMEEQISKFARTANYQKKQTKKNILV
jgi:N,N'-diacetyllegionaminate synthase